MPGEGHPMNRFALLAALAVVLFATQLSAAPLCSSAALSTYSAAGFSCEINGALFENFSFSSLGSAPPVPLTDDEINVVPIFGAGFLGLRFEGNFEGIGRPNGAGPAEGLNSTQYRIMYTVTDLGKLFNAITAEVEGGERFAPNPLKFGNYVVGSNVTNDGALAILTFDDIDQVDNDTLNSARTFVSIDNTITMTGGASAVGSVAPVGTVSFDAFESRLAYDVVVPEPATFLLIGTVLIALPFLRRRL
jgi:hypothetical protein